MSELVVVGKNKLNGELSIQGSKNSCIPILAACVLIEGDVVLENCPDISDVREMLGVLSYLGCEVVREENKVTINRKNPIDRALPPECNKLRGSIIFAGAMLSLFGTVKMPGPGGCNIGKRPIDFHIEGLKQLGVEIFDDEAGINGKIVKNKFNGFYRFPKPSLGALENLLLRAISVSGICVFENCTREPEIVDFCDFLNACGAKIVGAGTSRIVVEGGHGLKGVSYRIPGDRIVAGTYLCATAIAGGNVVLKGVEPKRLYDVIFYLRKMGCQVFTDYQTSEIIEIASGRLSGDGVIITGPYPEFSTDLQPQMMAVSCFLEGRMVIKDTIYPERYGVFQELNKLGADACVIEDVVVINGRPILRGADVTAKDLRGGAALIIAALGATGVSRISGCEYVARGYQNIQRDLKALGADIEWNVEDEENRLM